jgi:hypothetical protein
MCGASFAAAVGYFILEFSSRHEMRRIGGGNVRPQSVSFRDITNFPRLFWMLSLSCAAQYCVVFPFLADATYELQMVCVVTFRGGCHCVVVR